MNIPINLKCDVCGSIIQLKIQAGWLESHPIRITCAKCHISILGQITFDQVNGKVSNFNIENAQIVSDKNNIDFFIKTSGELLTPKIKEYNKSSFIESLFPPFFTSRSAMSDEKMSIFKNNVLRFLYETKPNWHKYSRLFELFNNKNYTYLKKELNNLLPERLYPSDNMLEYNRAIHSIIIYRFSLINHNPTLIYNKIASELYKIDSDKLKEFIFYLKNKNDMLFRYQNSIYSILDRFVHIFQFIIPAYGTEFYNDPIDYIHYGTTTTSFEDLKQFYLDCYETIGEVLMIPLGLNNLRYRDNLQSNYVPPQYKSQSYDDLFNQFKGTRIQYLDTNEFFSKITNLNFDNKLRNAIGHNNYTYNGITQQITYIPNEKKIDQTKDIYLLQFAKECINLFRTVLLLDELIYHIKIRECILNGDRPRITSKDFLHKQKRNEKCLCGSGKKYKNCCGLNN